MTVIQVMLQAVGTGDEALSCLHGCDRSVLVALESDDPEGDDDGGDGSLCF